MIGGYVRFVRIQCLGGDPARLQFDRLTREQTVRLEEPIRYIRREWARMQMMRDVGGTGRSIHQMAGAVLHHVDVDGDCFLTNRKVAGRRVWDLHPGDALAEGQYRTGGGRGRGNRQLGVETDGYGRPVKYYFRHGGLLAPLNVEYSTFGGGDGVAIAAKDVQHIRDLSGEITVVRGWPRCTQVIEDIARLDEWYSALVRGAITRAAIGLALKRMEGMGDGEVFSMGDDMGAPRPQESEGELPRERLPRYQDFARNAGTVMELDAGWEVQNIQSPAPTAQEALAIAMLERRVCAALRTSPATLLGDYKALSFSGGQLAHLQERQAIEDRQLMLANQFYAPIYKDWLTARWLEFVIMFPAVAPADFDALLYPQFRMRRYQILDKSKQTKPVLDTWAAGLITYSEARQELGHIGVDVDATIAEWKEDRKKLGLSETPDSASMGAAPPGADKDDDDSASDDGEDDEDDDDDG